MDYAGWAIGPAAVGNCDCDGEPEPDAAAAADEWTPMTTTDSDPAKDPAATPGPGTIGQDHLAVGRPTITQRRERARRQADESATEGSQDAAQWRGPGVNYAGLSGGRERRQDADDADRDGWTPVRTDLPRE